MHAARIAIQSLCLCSLLVNIACEGGQSNDAPPRLIEGGGIGDGEIDGKVNIFVVDGDGESDEAIAGAQIFIGEADEEAIEGVTDETGLLTVKDSALSGPTTITIVADGFVTSTWYGANGANITIPLNRPNDTEDFGQATLEGSIAGWADLPEPGENHFVVGLLGYSQTTDLGDPANEIEQPSGVGLPPNACIRAATVTECDWSLVARDGDVALVATILDIDTKGTETDADDTSEVIGFAYKLGLEVEDAVDQSGIVLTMLDRSEHEDVAFDLPPTPTGVDTAGVLLGIELGDEGILMLGLADASMTDTLLAPIRTGDFADATLRAIAFASNEADEEEDGRPASAILLRGITEIGAAIDFGEWMSLPSNLTVSGDEFSFTAAAGAALSTADILNSDNERVWSMVFLDDRTTFVLPTLRQDPIGTGDFDFSVSGLDDEIDLTDFRIDDLEDTLDRLSTNRVSFSR